MKTMKKFVPLVMCALLFSILAVSASSRTFGPDECCFNFISKRLDKNKVVSFKRTNTMCSKDAVVFKMLNGVEICAELAQPWVQKIIKAKTKVQTAMAKNRGSGPSAEQSD
ncbi:monocyte chemotactic protein 1B-like [Thalassophryne amazonica]|uniref:monocyte chemotactic protein 1B-like n=1 Tax=Thalassophryne amazonica TaxID=390379 RepID=UPI001471CD6B|nr:monocyte chemotactic protein 1B-like [Thalassophryne amazonica]XP_034018497.1 monocyte chemotactic protein 1B-like [Thalassophryne amazonica]